MLTEANKAPWKDIYNWTLQQGKKKYINVSTKVPNRATMPHGRMPTVTRQLFLLGALLVVVVVPGARASSSYDRCTRVNCGKACNETNFQTYQPQNCDDCCQGGKTFLSFLNILYFPVCLVITKILITVCFPSPLAYTHCLSSPLVNTRCLSGLTENRHR